MKRIITFLLILISAFSYSQTIITVGPGQDYLTINQAYAAIPEPMSGPYEIHLMSGFSSASETFPIVFYAKNGASATNTIKVIPQAANMIISSANDSASIIFSGGKYVTLDGRVGGTGSTIGMKVYNTHTDGLPVLITNGTQNCAIKYCDIKGVFDYQADYNPLVKVSVGSVNSPCIDNYIENNDIATIGSSIRDYGIRVTGSTSAKHRGINIIGNRIYDVRRYGVLVENYCSDINVNNNHLFNANSSFGSISYPIYVDATAAPESGVQQITINGNYIGGDTLNAQGTPLFVVWGIYVNSYDGVGSTINIENNTIRNIEFYFESSTVRTAGAINCNKGRSALIDGNVIGDEFSEAGSIALNRFPPNYPVARYFGILTSYSDQLKESIVSNNKIGGIKLYSNYSGSESREMYFYGVSGQESDSSPTTRKYKNNFIGSPTVPGNIEIGYTSYNSYLKYHMYGIHQYSNEWLDTISSNTIANIKLTKGTYRFYAINGENTEYNTVRNIVSDATNDAEYYGVYGYSANNTLIDSIEIHKGSFVGIDIYQNPVTGKSPIPMTLKGNIVRNLFHYGGGNGSGTSPVGLTGIYNRSDIEYIEDNEVYNFFALDTIKSIRMIGLAHGSTLQIIAPSEPKYCYVRNNHVHDFTSYSPSGGISCLGAGSSKSDTLWLINNHVHDIRTASSATGMSFSGISQGSVSSFHIENYMENNVIEDIENFKSGGQGSLIGIYSDFDANEYYATFDAFIKNNTIRNISTKSSGGIFGIITSKCHLINNEISNITIDAPDAAYSDYFGIKYYSSGNELITDTIHIEGNHISNIKSIAPGAYSNVTLNGIGLEIEDQTPTSNFNQIFIHNNLMEGITANNNSSGWVIKGLDIIDCPSEANSIGMAYNNIIRLGIDENGNTTSDDSEIYGYHNQLNDVIYDFHFNTIYITGEVANGTNYTYASKYEYTNGQTSYSNIFYNNRSNDINSSGKHYTFWTRNFVDQTVNYNLHYANGVGGVLATADDGATDVNTMQALQNAMVGQHLNSLYGNPLFIDPDNSVPNANMSPGVGSPAFGGGVWLPYITSDYYYFGRSFTPTIGAIENSITVGTETYDLSDIEIYPNPFSHKTMVILDNPIQNGTVNMFNMLGEKVMSQSFSGSSVLIDRGNLSAGYYILTVSEGENRIASEKVVIK